MDQQRGTIPYRLTLPDVGRRPTTPHEEAGHLMEPPVSSPKAAAQSEAETAMPAPLLDSPGLHSRFQGLRGVPYG